MLNSVQSIAVLKMLIYDVGGYRDQVIRPYEMFLTQQELDSVCERVHDAVAMSGSANVHPTQFATEMATALQPQMQHEKDVLIDGGWQKARHRFVLFLKVIDTIGVETIYLIAGYTNEHITSDDLVSGITSNVRIDPNADFIINSTTTISQRTVITNIGATQQVSGIKSKLVLANNGPIDFTNDPIQKLRPEDVCTHMSLKAQFGLGGRKKSLVASGNQLTTAPTLSDRTNSISSNYLAKMVNAYSESVRSLQTGAETTEVLSTAGSFLRDGSAYKDPFLRFIGKLHETNSDSAFTIADLVAMDPTCQSRIKKIRSGRLLEVPTITQAQGISHLANINPSHTQDWRVRNQETKMANILAQSVPALCFECGLGAISFMCHNYTPNHAVMFAPGGGWSLMSIDSNISVDLSAPLEQFRIRFEREIMPMLTYNGMLGISVQIHCDALNDTRINISIDGGRAVQYVQACFADALSPPVITTDSGRISALADQFETLFEAAIPGQGISNSVSVDYSRATGYNLI